MTYYFNLLPFKFNGWKVIEPSVLKVLMAFLKSEDLYPKFLQQFFSQSFILTILAKPTFN